METTLRLSSRICRVRHCRVTVRIALVRIVINRVSNTEKDRLQRSVLYTYEICNERECTLSPVSVVVTFESEGEE